MKTLILSLIVAICGIGQAIAGTVNQGSLFVYKSSYSETQDNVVLISSQGYLVFGGVFIGSGTSGGGYITVYNNQVWNAAMSTITSVDCGNAAVTAPNPGGVQWPVQVSSGLMYNKTGTCRTTIYWDILQKNPNVKP